MIDPAELKRQEYVGRINRVIDYIRDNLAGDLRLDVLARVARFSPFHFHRVFKSVVGETLNDYIRRVRAQRAAGQLIHNPTLSITEIAVGCGYSSPSAFAREFRRHFGVSASQFRRGGQESLVRFRREMEERGAEFVNPLDLGAIRTEMEIEIDVREMAPMHVAYVRHVGAYKEIGKAFQHLMRWAGPRRRLWTPDTRVLAVYHDNPDLTPVERLRAEACITVPEGTKTRGDIGTMTIPGGTFAVAHVEIDESQYAEAWDRLICDWMPRSGYQPDERMCFEMYLNDARKHPEGKHVVEICEPVRPL